MVQGRSHRSLRSADNLDGPAKRTRAATAGEAADAANDDREGAPAVPAAKRQRLRRLRKAQPEPGSSVLPNSPVQDVPSGLVSVNHAAADGAATWDGGDTSGDAGSDDGAHTSAKDQEEEIVDWPGGDSSPTVVLDMVFWGAGLGRLQLRMPVDSTLRDVQARLQGIEIFGQKYNAQQFDLRVLAQADEQTAADGNAGPARSPQLRKYTSAPDGQYRPIGIHLAVSGPDEPATDAQEHPSSSKTLQEPVQEQATHIAVAARPQPQQQPPVQAAARVTAHSIQQQAQDASASPAREGGTPPLASPEAVAHPAANGNDAGRRPAERCWPGQENIGVQGAVLHPQQRPVQTARAVQPPAHRPAPASAVQSVTTWPAPLQPAQQGWPGGQQHPADGTNAVPSHPAAPPQQGRQPGPNAGKARLGWWTLAETRRLIDGFLLYGRSWRTIQAKYNLSHRSNVHLKDRWRTIHTAAKYGRGRDAGLENVDLVNIMRAAEAHDK